MKGFIGETIDFLRERGRDTLADKLQFGIDGEGEQDGHRCIVCDQCAGGDRKHRCWIQGEPNYLGSICSICASPQFMTPSGQTCRNGHGGVPSIDGIVELYRPERSS